MVTNSILRKTQNLLAYYNGRLRFLHLINFIASKQFKISARLTTCGGFCATPHTYSFAYLYACLYEAWRQLSFKGNWWPHLTLNASQTNRIRSQLAANSNYSVSLALFVKFRQFVDFVTNVSVGDCRIEELVVASEVP